jgi:PAS domain S-box-containing protein
MIDQAYARRVFARLDRLDGDALRDFAKRLYEERDFFHLIFDSIVEGILVTDQDEVVRYMNSTAELLLARKRETVLGRPLLECLESVDFYNMVRAALREHERVRSREVGLYLPADRILNLSVFPLLREGRVSGNIVLFMDITREKKEQQKLRRAESVAALSSITAGIAHEIKNPLGAIDIHLQLMERELADRDGDPDDAPLSRYLHVVREEVARLNTIVVDFLAAIRPMRLTRALICPNRAVEELAGLLRAELESRDVSLNLELDEALPAIPIDFQLLRQALHNLVKNAMEAIEGRGVITIRSRADADQVVLEVADTGKGIPRDRLNTIFEPYFTTKPSGTGLGLTIVYRIVREHQGDLTVESPSGEGAVFRITLPRGERPVRRLGFAGHGEKSSEL